MNPVILTQTTTHRGVTTTKLCTMIEGKKFCEVEETTPANAGAVMLGIFGAIIMWTVLSFITYKVLLKFFKVDEFDTGGLVVTLFSFLAPLAYLGLFLVLFG